MPLVHLLFALTFVVVVGYFVLLSSEPVSYTHLTLPTILRV